MASSSLVRRFALLRQVNCSHVELQSWQFKHVLGGGRPRVSALPSRLEPSPARFHSTVLVATDDSAPRSIIPSASPSPRASPIYQSRAQTPGFPAHNAASAPFSTTAPSPSPATSASGPRTFDELDAHGLDPTLLETLRSDLKLKTMTDVQAQTIPATIAGDDMLAQAKTGTGKTIAFLLPAIHKMATTPNRKPGSISLLVISPTRELALQISAEAKNLLKRHHGYHSTIHAAVGGTNVNQCLRRVVGPCDVLVATPGRLLDHLNQADGALRRKMQGLQTLVLDEADRLLDMGFLPDIERIIAQLPDKKASNRQGMLFSATINARVKEFAGLVCSPGYKFINTIPEGEPPTHQHVPQRLTVVPEFSHAATALLGSLRQEMATVDKESFKAIIFAPTAHMVDFYAKILESFDDMPPVLALHSRISQSKRTANTEKFRKAKSGLLVATDVVARGMDFPGVTTVFQVGLPTNKEAYIHRLGRTARAGADGQGISILTSHESKFAHQTMSMIKFKETPADLSAHGAVLEVAKSVGPEKHGQVYLAWLGFYKGYLKILNFSPTELVRQANQFAMEGLGADRIPGIENRLLGKMGLRGVPGLNVKGQSIGVA